MKYRSDFDLCLTAGNVAEKTIWDLFTRADDGELLIEVKTDFKAHATGNLFFEYASRGRPSGIAATRSAWWAQAFPDAAGAPRLIIFFQAERLRRALRRLVQSGDAAKKRGGDEDTSEGVLVPVRLLMTEYLNEEE